MCSHKVPVKTIFCRTDEYSAFSYSFLIYRFFWEITNDNMQRMRTSE